MDLCPNDSCLSQTRDMHVSFINVRQSVQGLEGYSWDTGFYQNVVHHSGIEYSPGSGIHRLWGIPEVTIVRMQKATNGVETFFPIKDSRCMVIQVSSEAKWSYMIHGSICDSFHYQIYFIMISYINRSLTHGNGMLQSTSYVSCHVM